MPTFRIKEIEAPLFGVIEADDQEKWLDIFSSDIGITSIDIDAAALDLLANELQFDPEGLAVDAERYVGDLGEIIVFLLNRAKGKNITRIVSWRAAPGQVIKGGRFPQPDFLVEEADRLMALEVKSTEALNYIELKNSNKSWQVLKPCSSVGVCRKRALPQLGFLEKSVEPIIHSLIMRDGYVVPFPVGKGIANAVIAVDGRTAELRDDSKFRTPPTCRKASRDCWNCLPRDCHFVVATMPNAPGMLSLGGSFKYRGQTWLRTYERWGQALEFRDLLGVRETLRMLAPELVAWLVDREPAHSDVLREFWMAYLGDAMRSRGLNLTLPDMLNTGTAMPRHFGWDPAPVAEPSCRLVDSSEITAWLREYRKSDQPFIVTANVRRAGHDNHNESLTIKRTVESTEYNYLSEVWWRQRTISDEEAASSIAWKLLSLALGSSDWTTIPNRQGLPLRRLSARVGDAPVHLGWELEHPLFARSIFPRFWEPWGEEERWQLWPLLLHYGDPRVRLRVMPDGRASLRVPTAS